MDPERFDDLTRSVALSRRRALRLITGIVAGTAGLRIGARETTAQSQRGCSRRPDGSRCGQCGVCSGGFCAADAGLCRDPHCQECNVDTLRCIPVTDGEPCIGECGGCIAGRCNPLDFRCSGDLACNQCDPATFTCAPRADGTTCGDCGECSSGACVETLCPVCEICNGGTCEPIPEGEACGECGVCNGGTCIDDQEKCSECLECEQAQCVPESEGGECGGCGRCTLGVCIPDHTRCNFPCEICAGPDNTCIADSDGQVCEGECGSCQNGQCLPDATLCDETNCQVCDAGTMTCDGSCTQCTWECCSLYIPSQINSPCLGDWQCCTQPCMGCGFNCVEWRDGVVGGICDLVTTFCDFMATPCPVQGSGTQCCGANSVCTEVGCQST